MILGKYCAIEVIRKYKDLMKTDKGLSVEFGNEFNLSKNFCTSCNKEVFIISTEEYNKCIECEKIVNE